MKFSEARSPAHDLRSNEATNVRYNEFGASLKRTMGGRVNTLES